MIGGIFGWAAIMFFVGLIPGFTVFPWLASPVGPGLWKLSTPFTRIFLTVSQMLRGRGVLVKRASGEYDIGTYLGNGLVQLEDRKMAVDEKQTRWGLFGKRGFGIAWEARTDLHERAMRDAVTDGGGFPINMAAIHRIMRGTNDADAISRTEEKAKAKHGGGESGFSDKLMALLIIVQVILGTVASWWMLG